MTADEMATRLVEIVMSNDDYPQEFCNAVKQFCDKVVFEEFKAEYLRRSLNHEEI